MFQMGALTAVADSAIRPDGGSESIAFAGIRCW